MQFVFSPVVLTLFLSTALCLGLAGYCCLRRTAPGALALAGTFLACSWWAAAYALELAGVGLETKLFWAHLKFLGLATVVPLWFVFILCLSDHRRLLRPLAPLGLVPLVTIALALCGDPGGLLYRTVALAPVPPFTMLDVEYGRWFTLHLTFNVLLMGIGPLFVVREFVHPVALARRQSLIALLSVVPPSLGSWPRILHWGPWPGLDYAPFSFLLMGLLMLWAFYGERVLDLVPIAREAVIEGMRDAVLVIDPRGRLLDLNPAARQLLPATSGLLGRPLGALLPLPPALTAADSPTDAAATIALPIGGVERVFDFTRTPLIVRGVLQGAVVGLRDVTERERAMAQIAHLAQHDPLTGLLNRATFIARLDATLAAAGGTGSALLFLDLDGFKAVNDTYGHAVGDWLLIEAGARLRPCLPAGGLLARLGGDEFTVCLPTTAPDEVAAVARAIGRVLGEAFWYGEHAIRLAVSIGSAVAPDDGRAALALLHAADVAMYVAKDLGRAEDGGRDPRAPRHDLPLNRPMARAYAVPPRPELFAAGPPSFDRAASPQAAAQRELAHLQDERGGAHSAWLRLT